MKVIWNNEIVDRSQVRIDPEDRGYQFGDGIYEVIRAYNGTFFCLEEHLDRFYSSASKIEMNVPYTPAELKHLVNRLLDETGIQTGNLYLQLTRGVSSPRNHMYPDAGVLPMLTGTMTAVDRDAAKMEAGIPTIVTDDIRWLKCDIKMISLLGNIMVKHEAHKHNAEEAILHRDGIVTECSSSNLAIVKNGEILTHPDGNLILPGITKLVWIRCAKALGYPVREVPFSLDDLYEAEEVFCSSTTIEVMPVSRIGDHVLFDKVPGKVTRALQNAYLEEIEQQCGLLTV
ncbi:D-alanine aminotransferase [Alkalibacterium sp. AK22]|uniref:D-amino-acid transaminase n=1 Tax=Alkalibacterium sp. AK22 TaxID=1229520 RepID=UPI000452BCD8|nr:D-amino-acid transaminase [Alkalibacterium sp. AK22]EXJ22912.1 D-alanine aminotransferase [Alkalibacterium sp. AK22]